MRIIGGRFKGMTIEAPRGVLSRPPLSIIRESVFNIIGSSIEGKSVLDLFAGSGSFGMEALSRGAGEAQFVDSARRCTDMVGRNARKLNVSDISRVATEDAVTFIRQWSGPPFDIVFVDPPFLSGKVTEALSAIDGSRITSDDTLVVARTHWREKPALPEKFSVVKRRKFGESVVLFIRQRTQGSGH